ncbi:MAG: hypothetical protein ACKVH8_11515 [Pirellulales bacterium]|jgi:hypothetical protein
MNRPFLCISVAAFLLICIALASSFIGTVMISPLTLFESLTGSTSLDEVDRTILF